MNIDWSALEGDLEGEVRGALKEVVEGAEEDLKAFGLAIAKDLVRAAKEGNREILQELGHQGQVLAEINRIRLVNTTWAHVGNVLSTIGSVAIKVAAAAVLPAV